MIVEHLFPTIISHSIYPDHKNIEKKLIKYCCNFPKKFNNKKSFLNNGKLFTTFQNHNLLEDINFKNLNDWVKEQVKLYVEKTTMNYNIKFEGEAFFNIYNKNDYQESHNHFGYIISCIYFLKANKKASKVYFKPNILDNIKYDNFLNSPHSPVFYEAQPGKLLIFRSYLDHFVEQHLDSEKRISIAYNFK